MPYLKQLFGSMPDGSPVYAHRLLSGPFELTVIDYGATIQSLIVPDHEGRPVDVVLGQDNLEGYLNCPTFQGAVIGRVANRVSGAAFELDGAFHQLERNSGSLCIHSGSGRYGHKLFQGKNTSQNGVPAVTLTWHDGGEAGFPGEVIFSVRYSLTQDGSVLLEYAALPTARTPMNITNHCYFNLNGHNGAPVDNHQVSLCADYYLPNGSEGLPTGEILSVEGSPFDLRDAVTLGAWRDRHQIRGFDHCFCIRGRGFRLAGRGRSPDTGISMDVYTDLPGMHFFTPGGRNDLICKGGAVYGGHPALCYETEHFPNAINLPHFPDNVYGPDKPFHSRTAFVFTPAKTNL